MIYTKYNRRNLFIWDNANNNNKYDLYYISLVLYINLKINVTFNN